MIKKKFYNILTPYFLFELIKDNAPMISYLLLKPYNPNAVAENYKN